MSTIRRLGALTGAALLVVSGCGAPEPEADMSGDQGAGTATTAGSTPSADRDEGDPKAPASDDAVPEPLQFTSRTLDGAPFDGASLHGKPAVLWFWAPWCPNCRREAPGVRRVASEHGGEVRFVGVAAQDDVAAMHDFVDEHDLAKFDHLADVDAEVWRHFGVTYQPAYAFIGADGSVEVVKGGLEESELADRVDAL
jgi:thiol-disulfide isomerase/thioredoxin